MAIENPQGVPQSSRLWEQFKGLVLERIATMEQAAAALGGGSLQEGLRRQAEIEAHRLAGSLGSIGFPEGTRIAREIEGVLHDTASLSPARAPELSSLVVALRDALPREGA